MSYNINFVSLGVKITPATTKEELAALCAKHPIVKKTIDKLDQLPTINGKGKKGGE